MSKNIDTEKIKAEIKQIVAEIAEVELDELTPEATFTEDLGVDSMMALEIVASIEKKYKISVPEEEIPTIRSLQNVYDIVLKILG
ncbi:MAG: acyl carrier protein [Candidatus Omnitrophica bacterium]|nr:acyl carrier protein [Candidatus Omnitrophota bacterium]MDD5081330.1 acyl carrier protein [Candidatus Omnitrophota bacterium]MDD5440984.1 acyl carrier protein [Candidatus Omnitrophota bacterium]